MGKEKLFMLLLGCKPEGRFTEQHDVFFGIGHSLTDLLPQIKAYWPGNHTIHIDAWREVTRVDGFAVVVAGRNEMDTADTEKLFFLNLGGYKENEFEEFHYKMLVVTKDKGAASQKARQTAFYKHAHFAGADSHIDDKYGVDVDDLYEIADILPAAAKEKFSLQLQPAANSGEDEWHIGYTKLSSLA